MSNEKAIQKIDEIRKFAHRGSFIFRGEPEKNEKISSRLYRSYKDFLTQYPDINLKIMQDLVLEDVNQYIDFANNLDILTELQHYGGDTNLIDFSYDYQIALFFACDSSTENVNKDGRLILLPKIFEGIQPTPKKPNNRIVFQKSVFVKCDIGYISNEFFIPEGEVIPEGKGIIITIPHDYKQPILDYLRDYHNISKETVYGDLLGYIKNQKGYQKAYEHFQTGIEFYDKNEPQKSIISYTKAIELKPNFYRAYYNRGNSYKKKGEYDLAIADYSKAIEINPNHTSAYNNRGTSYDKKGEYDRAITDYNKAIELNPNEADVYYNRGLAKKATSDDKAAKADFQTALPLAKQQGNKELADRIQKNIDALPADSGS